MIHVDATKFENVPDGGHRYAAPIQNGRAGMTVEVTPGCDRVAQAVDHVDHFAEVAGQLSTQG